jgi:diaminohydroxyphosphoribosylaminopyrimidine deaminase/5-amino-6-(5-phosphoribosylamino)uracil reductase
VLAESCARFHAPFFKFIRTGLPWVVLKLAMGTDHSLGPPGLTTQITPPDIQNLAHALRRACEAIVVGGGTVAIDDPQLTDRWPTPTLPHRTFLRVVLDSRGALPLNRRVWQVVPGQPTLRAVVGEPAPLRDVEDLRLPPGPGGCSLRHLLHELAARNVGRVLFEGGGTVAQQLLEEDLVDEYHRFVAFEPAGGVALPLDLSGLPRIHARIPFPTGIWEVLIR